jgi:hypothetical protein
MVHPAVEYVENRIVVHLPIDLDFFSRILMNSDPHRIIIVCTYVVLLQYRYDFSFLNLKYLSQSLHMLT